MSEEESKLPNIRVYQPWSAPLLHFRLSEEQIEDLLEITDLILEDENKKSYASKVLYRYYYEHNANNTCLVYGSNFSSCCCWCYCHGSKWKA